MTTAIIGVGRIGTAVANDLVAGGETVILAARHRDEAEKLSATLGASASAADVQDAVRAADTVVLAVWLDATKELIGQLGSLLEGKVVVDPSNPVSAGADGTFARTLPAGVSSGSVLVELMPDGARFVKAFGTVAADALTSGANRSPRRAVLFYATNDESAETSVRRLIAAAGFDPVGVGGIDQAIRIEMYGDLHQFGGLDGKLLDVDEAAKAVAAPSS